jgi:mannose-6-phosphate isomerase-like protein (cupin superfamily)
VTDASTFRYSKPEVLTKPKAWVPFARSDICVAGVQVIQVGGENNLHSHNHLDGVWFVLGGRARFYTTDDTVIAELSKGEGVFIPRKYPYWFESVGPEPLEILQFEASDRATSPSDIGVFDRVDLAPRKPGQPDPTTR